MRQQSASHLATTDPLAVDITATEASMDGFIYDIITITVDDKHWIDRPKARLYWSSIYYSDHYSHQNP